MNMPFLVMIVCSRRTGADLPILSKDATASQRKRGPFTLVYLLVQSGSQFRSASLFPRSVRQPFERQVKCATRYMCDLLVFRSC